MSVLMNINWKLFLTFSGNENKIEVKGINEYDNKLISVNLVSIVLTRHSHPVY